MVNKTLLRSLKRFYTAKFENDLKFKQESKFNKSVDFLSNIEEFTKAIYLDDPRFKLPKFAGVSMSDLVFYMGMCINPTVMKKHISSAQSRSKFQNFYSCLYQYSHKKLQKLLTSRELYFMFSRFFEDGSFDSFLASDSTLGRNPEVYRKASEYFIE